MNDSSDFTIDGISLDIDNKEFNYALESVQYTNKLIYLTGKAGTGKTTFLKYLRKVTNKKMVVLAPTGVAAINAKGQTVHSFFQLSPSLFVPNDSRLTSDFYNTFRYSSDKQQIIRNLELLVIDEVSMLRCDLLDAIDIILRTIRKQMRQPFGGVQVLLIGDTFQLPPIAQSDEQQILKQYYESEFFFSSKVLMENKPLYIELKKIYRQKEQEFIDILNRIRIGKPDVSDIQTLNSRIQKTDTIENKDAYIILTTTNNDARFENKKKLDQISSEQISYNASVSGEFSEKNYPTDFNLELKVGAQVMFLRNNLEQGYYNGKIGKVLELNKDNIVVEIENQLAEKRAVVVEKLVWKNIKYAWNESENKIEEDVTGTFEQFPLKLAWAITVHKSQGMTFEKVIADVSKSFAAGQVYVALSRCTSLNGLLLKSKIDLNSIKTDSRVITFAKNEVPETLILEELQKGKANHYYAEARKGLKSGNAEMCYDNLIKAIRYRNDIETSQFKRLFCVWFNKFQTRFAIIQSKNANLLESVKGKNIEISNINREKDVLQKTTIEQCNTIERLNEDISCYNSDLAEKRDTIKTKNDEILLLKDSIQDEQIKNEALNLKIKELQEVINSLQLKKSSLERDKNKLAKELERVKNIKWYQKLFGKE